MDVDILDPVLYRSGDPHALYARLRRESPLCRDRRHQFWVASKYDDVVSVSKQPKQFCSGQGVVPGSSALVSIATMDEPRHTQVRKLVNRGFTPRMVRMLEPRIRETVKQSIDAVAQQGSCEFVRDIAVPLPLVIIAELLGIDRADRSRFHTWSDEMIAAGGGRREADPEIAARSQAAFVEYAGYLGKVCEDRRREPRDDLVTILVQAQDAGTLEKGEAFLANDFLMFMTLLLVAGNETTRNAISGGIQALSENPQEREKLLADPSLVPVAVEEILRWVSPVIAFYRTATRDVELRGQPIRKGEQVVLLYPSANRDEEAFEDAGCFRVDRQPNPHVAFGIGNHFCLGANLARLELRVLLEELLRRLPDIRMAPGSRPVYTESPFVRGIREMPVVFTPEAG